MSLVKEHLERRGVAFEVIPHGQASTSLDEAQALGIAAGELVTVAPLSRHPEEAEKELIE